MNSLKIFLIVEYLATSESQRIMFPIFVDVLLHHKANQKRNRENKYCIVSMIQGRLRWGAGGATAPSAFIHGGMRSKNCPSY